LLSPAALAPQDSAPNLQTGKPSAPKEKLASKQTVRVAGIMLKWVGPDMKTNYRRSWLWLADVPGTPALFSDSHQLTL
jgi:hypothetical protein